MLATGLNPYINAQGFASTGMLTVVIGAVTNILLDPVFIFVFGMGVRGAALATILSQILSAFFVLRFLTGEKAELRLTPLQDLRELPANLAVVWTKAFCGCSSLREIFLGDSVEALGSAAFRGCAALEKVRIPKGVEMTSGSAFGSNCRAALTGPGQAAGLMISRDPEVYYHPVLKKVTVSEGIAEMPTYVLGRAERRPRCSLQISIECTRDMQNLRDGR